MTVMVCARKVNSACTSEPKRHFHSQLISHVLFVSIVGEVISRIPNAFFK